MVCDFVLIEAREQLRQAFPLLDEGVEAIEARNDRRCVIAADLFSAALAGQVELRLVRADGEAIGFLATSQNSDIAGRRELYVWMLYLRPGCPDVMPEVAEELDYVAGSQGCEAISFSTSRPAWERRLAPFGYRLSSIEFRKEVGHG